MSDQTLETRLDRGKQQYRVHLRLEDADGVMLGEKDIFIRADTPEYAKIKAEIYCECGTHAIAYSESAEVVI